MRSRVTRVRGGKVFKVRPAAATPQIALSIHVSESHRIGSHEKVIPTGRIDDDDDDDGDQLG